MQRRVAVLNRHKLVDRDRRRRRIACIVEGDAEGDEVVVGARLTIGAGNAALDHIGGNLMQVDLEIAGIMACECRCARLGRRHISGNEGAAAEHETQYAGDTAICAGAVGAEHWRLPAAEQVADGARSRGAAADCLVGARRSLDDRDLVVVQDRSNHVVGAAILRAAVAFALAAGVAVIAVVRRAVGLDGFVELKRQSGDAGTLGVDRNVECRSVVLEQHAAGNIGAARCGVAVAIGRGDLHRDGVGGKGDALVLAVGVGVIERDILRDGQHAGQRVDVERESDLVSPADPVVVGVVDANDKTGCILVKDDVLAFGGLQARSNAVVVGEFERVDQRVLRSCAIGAKSCNRTDDRAGALGVLGRPHVSISACCSANAAEQAGDVSCCDLV